MRRRDAFLYDRLLRQNAKGETYVPAITSRLSDYGMSYSGRKPEEEAKEFRPVEIDPRGLPTLPIWREKRWATS